MSGTPGRKSSATPLRLFFVLTAPQFIPSWALADSLRVDGEDPSDREVQAEAPDRPKDMPLSLLPEPRSLEAKAPRPAAMEAIDELLAQIVSKNPGERERAAQLLLRAKTDWVSGIERRINRLAERADRNAMKSKLESIRKLNSDDDSPAAGADYLKDVLAAPQPTDQAFVDLTQLLAMSRMLSAIATADAARSIVFIYSRFGEFMRIDCQRQLDAIGERATAALIDTRRHQAPKIAAWAERLLRLRGKLDPHDAVRTDDSYALAEILIALGRSRDPEVTQLLLSFAASDRGQVQQAAREGLVLLGDVGSWQLKDAYKDITGKTPPREWTWKRTARELFTEYDRLKLEQAYAWLAQAKRELSESRFEQAIDAYNKINAQVPFFQQSGELATGYLGAARGLRDANPKLALEAAYRAETLASDPATAAQAEALRRLLEAEELRKQGWIDQTQLKRARALDATLVAESTKLAESANRSPVWGATARYVVAISVAVLSLLGAVWILTSAWTRRRPALGQKDRDK